MFGYHIILPPIKEHTSSENHCSGANKQKHSMGFLRWSFRKPYLWGRSLPFPQPKPLFQNLLGVGSGNQRLCPTYDLETTLMHVYRERNEEADKLSKAGLNLQWSHWKILEIKDSEATAYPHRPFFLLSN